MYNRPLTHTHTHTVSVSPLKPSFNSQASNECFGVIRGVCSILPGASAVWWIKSPTCLCFTDLCCPGNRCRDFPFLHFFSSVHYPYRTPHHHCCQTPPLHSTRGCFLPHDLPHSTISHTHTGRHTHTLHAISSVLQSFHNVTGRRNRLLHDISAQKTSGCTPCSSLGLLWFWGWTTFSAATFWTQEGKKRGGAGEVEETKREQLKSRTSGSKNKAGCTLCFILLFVWASKNVNVIYKAQTISKFAMLPFDVVTICSTWQPLIVVVGGDIWLVKKCRNADQWIEMNENTGCAINLNNELYERWSKKVPPPAPWKCSSNWLMGWDY